MLQLYPQLSSRGLRRLVMPVDELMQSERDLVGMRCTPGDKPLQLDRIVSDGTYFDQLGFNDFRGSHRNLEWHIDLKTSFSCLMIRPPPRVPHDDPPAACIG